MPSDAEHAHKIESFPSGVRTAASLKRDKLGGFKSLAKVNSHMPSPTRATKLRPQRGHSDDATDSVEGTYARASAAINVEIRAVKIGSMLNLPDPCEAEPA